MAHLPMIGRTKKAKVVPIRAQRQRLSTNFFWMLAGNAFYIACQWGVLVATVKFGSTEMVGQISLGFSICAPVFLLCQLRLRAATASDAGYEYEAPEYFALRLLCTVLALLSLVLICLCGHFSRQTTLIILAVAVAKAIESGSDLFYGFLQNAEQMRPIAISMILRGAIGLAGLLAVLLRYGNLLWALIALCAGWGVVLILFDLPAAANIVRTVEGKRLHLRWRWSILTRLARLALPLGISAMLMSLAVNIPRYFIQHFAGVEELGLFSALAYLTIASSLMVNSLAETTIPRFAKFFRTRQLAQVRQLLWQSLTVTLAISAASIALSAWLSRPLVTWVYRAQYAQSGSLLTWLMVAGAIANIGSIFSYLLLSARKFNLHLACLAALAVSTAVASQILVPRWHIEGAAFASIVGFSVQAIVAAWCARRVLAGLGAQRLSQPRLLVSSTVLDGVSAL